MRDEIREKLRQRAKKHDMDKVFLYLFFSKEEVQKYHINHKAHHLDNVLEKQNEDYYEAVIDFESSAYTKPDKPSNAYDFIRKCEENETFDKDTIRILDEIMEEFCINFSYYVTQDEEKMKFVSSLKEFTEEDIIFEIVEHADCLKEEIEYIKKMKIF